MYVGCWHDKNRLLAFRVGPDIAAINLEFPGKSRDEFPAEVLIQAVIYPGKKPPEYWATEAQDNDPGSKLAFLVTLSHGPCFVHLLGEGAARKANTFIDIQTLNLGEYALHVGTSTGSVNALNQRFFHHPLVHACFQDTSTDTHRLLRSPLQHSPIYHPVSDAMSVTLLNR